MISYRPWAYMRRMQYILGALSIVLVIGTGMYFGYFYSPASCFDYERNRGERGIDCGGGCARICSFDVLEPTVVWTRAFEIVPGQYNAVAYIENKNIEAGTAEIPYTLSLYDEKGLIIERKGITVLPPDSVYPVFEGRIMTGGRKPTQAFLALNHEAAVWLPAESARQQFVIEERTLTDTDTMPRLEARLRNTKIQESEDVEVVATIFDLYGNALTASRTVVPRIAGRTTTDIVFTWPQPIARTVRSCEVPTDVMLAIDLSGSMNDDSDTPPEPITSVLKAASAFVQRLNPRDQVGVVTYATEAGVENILSANHSNISALISRLSIAPESEFGSTNIGDAITLARNELTSDRHNSNARKVLVLLTDGLANTPGDDPEGYAIEAARELKEKDTEIFTVGLGTQVHGAFLRAIASDEQKYFFAPSVATIDSIYESITDAICEDGPAVIDIIPKTPAIFK